MANTNLHAAKRAKADEFFTQWIDVEREMTAYLDHDPDVFRDKVILLPCDIPEWSNFTKFFVIRFAELGIKKLISTSYASARGSGAVSDENHDTAGEHESARGRIFTLTREDVSDGQVDFNTINKEYLSGDGDFRSPEVIALRDEADMIITNPPFSLFREFIAWCVEGDVKFSIIGNMNAITYKEVFPLIQSNKIWLGTRNGQMWFAIPDGVTPKGNHKVVDNVTLQGFGNICWFTNIEYGRRHETLQLMTMEDNIDYSKHKSIRGVGYPRYDNCDAIEVGYTDAIPSDHDGLMGVPISFLNKYCPEQFEIVRFRHGDDGKDLAIDGKTPYFRILIRHLDA